MCESFLYDARYRIDSGGYRTGTSVHTNLLNCNILNLNNHSVMKELKKLSLIVVVLLLSATAALAAGKLTSTSSQPVEPLPEQVPRLLLQTIQPAK